MKDHLIAGLLAGAAGTTALNAVTYIDMAVRGRGASDMPEQLAGRATDAVGLDLGDEETAENRRQGLAGLLGIGTGVGVSVAYGLLDGLVGDPRSSVGEVAASAVALGVVAALASDTPATAAGLTDPRDWPASSWISDAVPHLAYGAVAAITYDRLIRRRYSC
ncbi:hypothetical protein [Actinoallomurus iriomotensis]|uniref:DUF1440 domain-containing protein n=1 Tax=Actinoallomurus iriomotensis TaxID=478107 RepID=A0A9W6VWT3_9ACTN|nr:hypothetical protein [Actinoallomurus iriomotensis]GLY83150.1 hypothetical protein Airi02_010800 [Actinoallomurus iriomotensis]